MYFVYIIRSQKDNSSYTGLTTNLPNRIKEHNDEKSQYTKSRIPWKLIWYCVFSNKHRAAKFEQYLKSGSGIAFMQKRLV